MELREMRSFCAAARLRSISKARNYLGVGQPAVTNHIKRLEEELGTPLFDRIKRPIQLTPVGATFYQQAASLVEEIDRLVSSVSKAEDEGPVRLASTNGLISHTLLGPVDSFLSRYPKIHLRIQSRTKREVLQMVKEGEVDFGIVPGLQRDTDFNFQELFPYERVLLVPINHPLLEVNPISLDQIAQWPLILMGRGTATRTLLEEQFERRGLSYETVMEIDGTDMVKRYVTTGLGGSHRATFGRRPGRRIQAGNHKPFYYSSHRADRHINSERQDPFPTGTEFHLSASRKPCRR